MIPSITVTRREAVYEVRFERGDPNAPWLGRIYRDGDPTDHSVPLPADFATLAGNDLNAWHERCRATVDDLRWKGAV